MCVLLLGTTYTIINGQIDLNKKQNQGHMLPPLLSDICVSTSCYHIQQSRDVFPLHCLQEETERQHLIRIIWWREREELKGGTRLQQSCNQHWCPWSALLSVGWFVSNTHTRSLLRSRSVCLFPKAPIQKSLRLHSKLKQSLYGMLFVMTL